MLYCEKRKENSANVICLVDCLYLQGERAPSTSSYSLSSYDDIVRDASKNGRRWPSNHCFCLLGTLFLLGTGLAFGIYYGRK